MKLDVEGTIGFYIKKISEQMQKRANYQLKSLNVTLTQAIILTYLSVCEGKSAAQKEIEKTMSVSHPTATGLVKRMQLKGFVTTKTAPNGGKSKIVSLTRKGMDTLEKAHGFRKTVEDIALTGISEEEKKSLFSLLEKALDNLMRAEEQKNDA